MKLKAQTAIRLISEAKQDDEIKLQDKKIRLKVLAFIALSVIAVIIAAALVNQNFFAALLSLFVGNICSSLAEKFNQQTKDVNDKIEALASILPEGNNEFETDISAFHYEKKIKTHTFVNILMFLCFVLVIASSLFVPYITYLGEKVSLYNCLKEYNILAIFNRGEETEPSSYAFFDEYLLDLTQRFFAIFDADIANGADIASVVEMQNTYFPIAKFISAIVLILTMILFIIVIALLVGLIVMHFKLKPITNDVEIEVNTRRHRLYLVGTLTTIFAFVSVCALPYCIIVDLYNFLKNLSGGVDLGELLSVNAMMLILPILLFVAMIVIYIIGCIRVRRDHDLQCALLYSKVFRSEGMSAIK